MNDANSPAALDIHKFILFISGMSFRSGQAIENIRKICDQHFAGRFELQIIDITKEKEQAIKYQIIAVPALLRVNPAPVKVILGDLSDTQKVLKVLDIS